MPPSSRRSRCAYTSNASAGTRVARGARREHVAHVAAGDPRQAREPGLRLEHASRPRRPRGHRAGSTTARGPGSTVPDRVAITSPSSGVNPIVVSTERPPRVAHSDAPAPRWQLTTRRPGSSARSTSSAARRDAYACDSPWNPKRCTSQRSRHSCGSAYVEAAARERRVEGSVEARHLREVGMEPPQQVDARDRRGVDAAARAARARAARARRPASTRTASRNRRPPCTTR